MGVFTCVQIRLLSWASWQAGSAEQHFQECVWGISYAFLAGGSLARRRLDWSLNLGIEHEQLIYSL